MAPPIPLTEPLTVFAGDTLLWQINLADYPASQGYALHYRLINATNIYDITSTPSGDQYEINVPATTSAAWAPGVYDWQSYITDAGGDRFTVERGRMEVKANWAGQSAGLDTRSQARQILEALEAAWVAASAKRAFVMEYRIAGRIMRFATRQEWVIELNYWRRMVAQEERAAKIANGQPPGNKIYVRF